MQIKYLEYQQWVAIIHIDSRYFSSEINRIQCTLLIDWQTTFPLWAFLSPFYTIFNISHLKIVSSSETESRQSNKESGRKWKRLFFCYLWCLFFFFLSSLAVKNFKSKHLLVHGALLLLPARFSFLFFLPPFSVTPFSGCQISLPPSTVLLGTPREFPSHSSSLFFPGFASSLSECLQQRWRSFSGANLNAPHLLPGSVFIPLLTVGCFHSEVLSSLLFSVNC